MRRVLAIACVGMLLAAGLSAKPVRPRTEASASVRPRVVIDTNHGKIVLELYADKAPVTVKNFLQYVDERFYDGTIFHRTIPSFVIQGGGMMPGLKEKPARPPIRNEAGNGLSNERGTLAAARMADPDTATSQFYINTRDNAFLDAGKPNAGAGYCVFGRVVSGMDVVDRIGSVKTHNQGGHSDVPVQDVVILSIRRVLD